MSNLQVIILAAGEGKRMRSVLPKVLQLLGGRPLLAHVLSTAECLSPKQIHIVYGFGGDVVTSCFAGMEYNFVEQKKQLGTGHAVKQVLPYLSSSDRVLVLLGDVPLVTCDDLQDLINKTKENEIGLLTTELEYPEGFGRIVRDLNNDIIAIVEDKDATELQKEIKEINTGIILFPAIILQKYLPKLKNHNAQKEYYLTDVVSNATAEGVRVVSHQAECSLDVMGVNDRRQLSMLERYFQKIQAQSLMVEGVTLIDPYRLDVRGNLEIGFDVTIDVNVILEGEVEIGNNVYVGANCVLRDVKIGDNVEIKPNCVIEGAVIEDECVIGPFARIRPESIIAEGAHIGNFVEIKKSKVDTQSKINHLSYIGDAIIGKKVNIGAGTITCNYDGINKYQTIIEDGAFIGSDTQLVAPVRVGKGATIGAGSTIVEDAPSGKLTLARAKQVTVQNWVKKKKIDK